jgi:hypothetical protein
MIAMSRNQQEHTQEAMQLEEQVREPQQMEGV